MGNWEEGGRGEERRGNWGGVKQKRGKREGNKCAL